MVRENNSYANATIIYNYARLEYQIKIFANDPLALKKANLVLLDLNL